MPSTLAVALGGAFGAVARYGLDRLIERRSDSLFPWSTFAINVSGCLVIGVVIAALVDRHHTPAWVRAGLASASSGASRRSRPSRKKRSTSSRLMSRRLPPTF